MATWDLNVVVNILSSALGVTRATFGRILLMTEDVTFTEDYKIYETNKDAQDDTTLGADVKAAVATFFSQNPHPPDVAVGKKAADAAQSIQWTIGSGVAENDEFDIVITPFHGSAITGTYTAGAAEDETDVGAGLRADLTTKLAAEDLTVGGTGANVTVTADNAGEPFSYTSEYRNLGAGTSSITSSVTQANINYGTELATLNGMWSTWYGLVIDSRDKNDIWYTADFAEANPKMYSSQSSDADIKNAVADNTLVYMKDQALQRTFLSWHHDDAEWLDLGWLASFLSADPDTTSTIAAYRTIVGITPNSATDIDATAKANIVAQNGNLYLTFYGVNCINDGVLVNGDFIDVLLAYDWLKARVEERIAQLKLDQAALNSKIPYTQAGIDMVAAQVRAILSTGESIGHLAEGESELDVPTRASIDPADVLAREFNDLKATALLSGAIQKSTINIAVLKS